MALGSQIITTIAAWAALPGMIGTSLTTLYLLRRKGRQVDASTEKTAAETDAVIVLNAERLVLRHEAENNRILKQLDALERKASSAVAAEWICLENMEIMRRAMIQAGIPVPELRHPHSGRE